VKEKDLGLKFWAAVAVSAIGMGVAVAFVAGFFLGHFTGHHHTTTVVASATTSTEESTTAEESSEEEVGPEESEEAEEPAEEAASEESEESEEPSSEESEESSSEEGEEAEAEEGAEEEAEGGEEVAAAGAPNAEAGEEVFAENCSVCHGATGHGGSGGPDLTTMPKAKEQAGAEEQVTNGGGGMPAFSGTLSEEEITNVAAYVVEDIVGGK
jgi:mono/diheme cytochrome c family protein